MSIIPNFVTKKKCAGSYTVKDINDPFNREVTVMEVYYPNDGKYWIAVAEWVRDIYSDPVKTKREAVEIAHATLKEWDERGNFKKVGE